MITDWVSGVQKGQNFDYVIFEWSLSIINLSGARNEHSQKKATVKDLDNAFCHMRNMFSQKYQATLFEQGIFHH